MKKSILKKVISILLVVVMLAVSMGAKSRERVAIGSEQKYVNIECSSNMSNSIAKVAYIDNLSSDGDNVDTDIVSPSSVVGDESYEISFEVFANQLLIRGTVLGTAFSVTGSFETTNENRNALLFSSIGVSPNYEIAYMSIERKLSEAVLFYRGFSNDNSQFDNVIKLYMQSHGKNDLILIEIFIDHDFVSNVLNQNNLSYFSEKANDLQSWFVNYIEPISIISTTRGLGNIKNIVLDFSKTYFILGVETTFVFEVVLSGIMSDMGTNGFGQGTFFLEVTESYTASTMPSQSSTTQGYLQLQNVNIKVKSAPNIMFTSQQGAKRKNVQNYLGSITSNFSVNFGFNYGPISLGGSLSFNRTDSMNDANSLVLMPYSGANGVAATECGALPSGYYLQKQDAQYGFVINYLDVGGNVRETETEVIFEFVVFNHYEYTDSVETARTITILHEVK